jgi:filamentous hemagglutinin
LKKSGGWGSKETQRDEVTNVKNIGSEIKTGGDLTLVSGGGQRYQGAKLNSGNDLTLDSGGSITFEAVKDLHQESHEKSKGDLAWNSASGKGQTDETLRQSTLEHQGQLAIKAADGLKIDIKQIDQKSVSETIDAMVQADPNLAWLKEAEQRGDVNWQLVKELHDSFKYSNSGLGAGAQLAIAIVMAAFVGPAAMTALGGVGASAAVAAGGAAVATGAATNASISLINNKGNLGDVIKDVTSSDALKGYAISGITAGLTADYFSKWTDTSFDPVTKKITVDLSTWKGVGQFAANQGLQNSTSLALGKIMGQGGDLGDALQSTLFNTLAAASFNAVGGYTKDVYADGSLQKIAIHAMVGGLLAQVSGGDFKTGALAAGANEAMVDQLNTWVGGDKDLLNMSSQLVGMLAAATQKDADIDDLNTGKWVAENATQYNYLGHKELDNFEREAGACKAKGNCDDVQQKYRDLSLVNQDAVYDSYAQAPSQCIQLFEQLIEDQKSLQERIAHLQLDSNIPFALKLDLDRYQLQNASAISELIATKSKLANIESGASASDADRDSLILSAVSGGLFGKGGAVPKGMQSIIEPKIAQQMGKRGWTTDSLESVIANPNKTVVTKDTRFDPVSGTRLNDPATGYVAKDGSYVVRNDRTGAIVQVSDKNDKNWVAPWE